MPTVLRFDGLRVVIYPNDHSPEHVHVIGTDCEAVFELHCPEGPVMLREFSGLTMRQLRRLMEQLSAELTELCSRWESIHGSD
jgi:Fe2+ or Zn2+ uptake regulation protein